MAKYQHKIFEMYEFLDESMAELTPRVALPAAASAGPESVDFDCFDVMCADGITQVVFKDGLNDDAKASLRDDLGKLSDRLFRGAPVLLNFACVTSICDDSIKALVLFKQRLQTKGNRLGLCCLKPDVRASFFPERTQ